MLSRALSLATVTLLVGCLTAGALLAVENLEAGKTPSQIFSGTCNACHKSPRGLLKTVPASSLPGFLRQHYTTSSDMASVLSSFLISNGATDTRFQSKDQPSQGRQAGSQARSARPVRPPAKSRRADPRGVQAGCRRDHAARRRTPRPRRQTTARPDARRRQARRPGAGAGRDRQQNGRQAEARQARQTREEPPKTDEAAKEDLSKTAKVDAAKSPRPPSRPARANPTRAKL